MSQTVNFLSKLKWHLISKYPILNLILCLSTLSIFLYSRLNSTVTGLNTLFLVVIIILFFVSFFMLMKVYKSPHKPKLTKCYGAWLTYNFYNLEEAQNLAEKGDAKSQFRLAYMYDGNDKLKAMSWYTKAAELGDANAQAALGYMCLTANTKEYANAFSWFDKAAKQGHAFAQYCLGYMYDTGKHMTKDSEEAIVLFTKAAEQGLVYAQAHLAEIYCPIILGSKNYSLSYYWSQIFLNNYTDLEMPTSFTDIYAYYNFNKLKENIFQLQLDVMKRRNVCIKKLSTEELIEVKNKVELFNEYN